ncbi:class I SAM-dependent methyltransferase [Pedobacter deserti]|uniref:class I SAM-dependent methyltransferase n=1 Tax=Pedobacter deserti TaxID=2817382 RepID=UPI00210B5D7D|nr:class I SAM-dependent methyltransferase [Pedobacter sp. SYSU D00382]
MFHKESYDRHGDWYNQQFPTEESKRAYLTKRKPLDSPDLATWLQQLFFDCLDPLLKSGRSEWLTIGDPYGFDAEYILKKGSNAIASDLNTDMLSVAFNEGIIKEYRSENAEQLSLADQEVDYVLCKESYHHFPRPYAAMYEMMRVSRKGIVIIEPQDPVSKMPLLLFVVNTMGAISDKLVRKFWKNRFSYEPVGNFVYKVSEREFEKFAAGLDLPMVAFKRFNPNFYFKGADDVPTAMGNSKFRKVYWKKSLLDMLVKLRMIPSQVLGTIIFKQMPTSEEQERLRAAGYHLLKMPRNPYLNS